ncbi:reverse transcriptase domain protein [Metarhizium robertsii]|uniref:Reverse transcriptase domain protein n=1 Tax=Metarhizium robertsii TaxID=568076 RepID=A0A014N4Z2_9HYPO|nr:reverse transcriptase domain protein [Metarhizium robertsii]
MYCEAIGQWGSEDGSLLEDTRWNSTKECLDGHVTEPKDLPWKQPGATSFCSDCGDFSKYNLREEEFKWYLGIRVIRDRPSWKIYLCQDAYIDKIARKFKLCDSKLLVPSIPITTIPLVKHDGQASQEDVKAYQERVGSLMYIAVMTRPDIARAATQLARFLTNPSPEHLAALINASVISTQRDFLPSYMMGCTQEKHL